MPKTNRFAEMGKHLYNSKPAASADDNTEITTESSDTTKKGSSPPENQSTKANDKGENKVDSKRNTKSSTKNAKKDTDTAKKGSVNKRGRKTGTVLVDPKKQKRTLSISVSPEDEERYKKVLNNNPKKFRSMSHLVEQALDEYISRNKLK